MVVPTTEQFKALLLESMEFGNYGIETPVNEEERISACFDIFFLEKGWEVRKGGGLKEACDNWLRGLASACTIPFMNHEIIKWWESETNHKLVDVDGDGFFDVTECYWDNMALVLAVLFRQHINKAA